MNIVVVGLNHKTAPIDVREQFAFSLSEVERALASLKTHPLLKEAILLSTCNRVEIYTIGVPEVVVKQWLFQQKEIAFSESLLAYFYCLQDIDAVKHVMHVACGLDSLVFGESEILGQIKSAFSIACFHKTVGSQLDYLFRQAFDMAKRIRASTKIGACPVSVASTAVMVAKEWNTQLQPRVLIIGAGEVGRWTAKHAQTLTSLPLIILSRHLSHAESVANEVQGVAGELKQVEHYLQQSDIVITSTASKAPIIYPKMVAEISHPLLIIDLAVPRDVSSDVGQYSHITLCQLDQLKDAIQSHMPRHMHATVQAERLIEECVDAIILKSILKVVA